MRRLILAHVLAIWSVLALLAPNAAASGWCRTDPIVSLNGRLASIFLSAPLSQWDQNNSSGDILIQHPKNTNTKLVWVDPNGYFGQGVSTNFATNETLKKYPTYMEVIIRVYIPASSNGMPILVEWAPGISGSPVTASVHGVGNQWIELRTTLPLV